MADEQQLPMVMDADIEADDDDARAVGPILAADEIEAAWGRDRQVIKALLQNTAPHHWTGYPQYVRLSRHGADFIARQFGMDTLFTPAEPAPYYENGHFGFKVGCTVKWKGRTEQYEALCDSYDPGFGTNYDAPFTEKDASEGRCRKEQIGQPRKLPHQINRGNIMAKAMAKAKGNAVGRLLAIHAIPIEYFERIVGWSPDKIKFRGR